MATTPQHTQPPTLTPQQQTPAERPSAATTAAACRPAHDETACPACGATMHLWANYYRCRTCGFKESCCF